MSEQIASFSWTKIVEQFESDFTHAFSTDKKAHFDNLAGEFSKVDGAKGTWCSLVLLDAIVYILKNDQFNSCTRRAFKQQEVLYHCILNELKRIHPTAHKDIIWDKTSSSLRQSNAPDPQATHDIRSRFPFLRVEPLEDPWDTMESLIESLAEGPHSKAKNKFVTISEMLSRHETLAQLDYQMDRIVEIIITKALFVLNTEKHLRKSRKMPSGKSKSKQDNTADSPQQYAAETDTLQYFPQPVPLSVYINQEHSPVFRSIGLQLVQPEPCPGSQSFTSSPRNKHKRVDSASDYLASLNQKTNANKSPRTSSFKTLRADSIDSENGWSSSPQSSSQQSSQHNSVQSSPFVHSSRRKSIPVIKIERQVSDWSESETASLCHSDNTENETLFHEMDKITLHQNINHYNNTTLQLTSSSGFNSNGLPNLFRQQSDSSGRTDSGKLSSSSKSNGTPFSGKTSGSQYAPYSSPFMSAAINENVKQLEELMFYPPPQSQFALDTTVGAVSEVVESDKLGDEEEEGGGGEDLCIDASDVYSIFYIGPHAAESCDNDDNCSEVSLNSFECSPR